MTSILSLPHLMNFDPDTSSVTDFDASGTVTISPMSLKTSSTSQDNEVVSMLSMLLQQDPFTFEAIGQDGPAICLCSCTERKLT